jgi:hypothetical protein
LQHPPELAGICAAARACAGLPHPRQQRQVHVHKRPHAMAFFRKVVENAILNNLRSIGTCRWFGDAYMPRT